MKTEKFYVSGMHCPSCVILIESELRGALEVSQVKASLQHLSVEVSGDFGDKTPQQIAYELSERVKKHGYAFSVEKQKHSPVWADFTKAAPIAAGFIALFIIIQKLGLVNLVTSDSVGLGTAFVIGFIASVSTCMAVVGGLVLSMSANFAKQGSKIVPQIFFHAGRLVSFFILGGVIGAIGSAFKLSSSIAVWLGILVGVIMLVLGINLLDVFPWAKKLQPTIPKAIGKRVHALQSVNHSVTPLLVGIATFFLPCGFTQSMQLYTLTTGSFWAGAMIMFVFALGTLPVLVLLSFSSLGIHKKAQSGVFFKTAGLVVIFFGFFNLYTSFVTAGLIPPLISF